MNPQDRSAADKKLKRARTILFRKDIGMTFIGACAYKFNWDVHEMKDLPAIGYVLFDRTADSGDTTGYDGTIHMNVEYITKPDFTPMNVCALVTHELFHIFHKHGVRMGQRNADMWNIAADHVVDRDVREISNQTTVVEGSGKLEHYKGQWNIIQQLHKENPKCTVEEAYSWLTKKLKCPQCGAAAGSCGCQGQGQGQQNGKGSKVFTGSLEVTRGEGGLIEVKEPGGGTWKVNSQTGGVDQNDPKNKSMEAKQKASRMTDQIVSQARSLYDVLKQKGDIGGALAELLDDLMRVEIPWEELLERAIKKNSIIKPSDRSWSTTNRFYGPLGLTLPGTFFTEDQEGVGTLVIMVDTSGSISTKTLKGFSGIIMESMKYFEKIRLVVHDVEVHQVRDFNKEDISDFMSFLKNEGFQGRGGTSHRYAFDHVEKEIWKDFNEREKLSMVISLTDGYSDIENIWQKYEWIRNNTPLVFVIEGSWSYDFQGKLDEVMIINIKDEE